MTAEKIKDINLLESLPYEEPILEEVELIEEEIIEAPKDSTETIPKPENDSDDDDDEGQITLF